MTTHLKPRCPHCEATFECLSVCTDDKRLSAIFFCHACGKAFGAQLLRSPEPGEMSTEPEAGLTP